YKCDAFEDYWGNLGQSFASPQQMVSDDAADPAVFDQLRLVSRCRDGDSHHDAPTAITHAGIGERPEIVNRSAPVVVPARAPGASPASLSPTLLPGELFDEERPRDRAHQLRRCRRIRWRREL